MDLHSDIHLTRGDIGHTTLAERTHMGEEHEPGETILNADLVADKLSFSSPNVHVSPVMDNGDIEVHEGQTPIHPFNLEKELADIQTEGSNPIDLDHECTYPQSNPDQDILPASNPKELSSSECAVDPVGGPPSSTDIDDAEALTTLHSEEPPSSYARTVPTSPHNEEEGNTDDRLNSTKIVHGEADFAEIVGVSHPADDEETREDFIDNPLASLPPSSSPPQLFSSSPYASSQSSVDDVEHSKMTPAVESESCAISRGCAHDNHAVSVKQANLNSHSDSQDLHGHETTKVETSNKIYSQLEPEEGAGLEHSRKRIADPDESHGSQPTKRPKSDSRFDLPPAPKRATLASQHNQFKKLAAPFRPPLKFPNAVEGPTATIGNRKVESTISTTFETRHNKIDQKGSTISISLQHKTPNTSRSATQFKSPLVNRVVPVDARTIRLTPAVQALERKLQLLKRAIKVKEDNEEKVLARLAEKWIEAGREVSYGVWDATKDTGDFAGKVTILHKSGWESTDGKTAWGWDTKTGDAGEESCDVDPSEASCATGRPTGEAEDDNIGCNTLGNMLRQIGIAPEIFGWDDDKEAFYD